MPYVMLNWLAAYFRDRKQTVCVQNQYSTPRPVKAGVVQGSVIGPLLFSAYIDSVQSASTSDDIKRVFYADDLLVLSPYNSESDHRRLQVTIDDVLFRVDELG